jgi:hypothetical protein
MMNQEAHDYNASMFSELKSMVNQSKDDGANKAAVKMAYVAIGNALMRWDQVTHTPVPLTEDKLREVYAATVEIHTEMEEIIHKSLKKLEAVMMAMAPEMMPE